MERKLLVNKIICPDGTELRSLTVHDFVGHVQADGREYFIDGGLVCQRIGASDEDYIDCTCYTDDPIEKIREHFTWTSVLDENEEVLPFPIQRKLKDLDDSHVLVLVKWTSKDYPKKINDVFKQEADFRGLL